MKIKKRQTGYLLLEAIISLSLLTLVMVAGAETFSAAHRAQIKGANQKKIADCAERKLIELATSAHIADDDCQTYVRWTVTEIPVTPRYGHLVLHGILMDGGEVTFEASRLYE